ncbi:hypothetical protein [Romboutsia weinsteinii]|nr:hypothetical protein [Romboutsia weinsteinii]
MKKLVVDLGHGGSEFTIADKGRENDFRFRNCYYDSFFILLRN